MKIQVSRKLTQRYELYAQVTNKNVKDVIEHALGDWMDVVGEGDIEIITGVRMDEEEKHIPFPIARHSASMLLVN